MDISWNEPKVIYEDSGFIALSKPAGLVVHPARVSNDKNKNPIQPTLVDWLLKYYPEIKNVGDDPETRPGIVHRLDKETSGVMLVARTNEAFHYIKGLFQSHQVIKKYTALVFGVPREKQGVIEKPIGILSGTLKRSVHSKKMLKDAITEYKRLRTIESPVGPLSLLSVSPKTGRTHQIRVHLASIGHPIVGDPIYAGKRRAPGFDRLMLHATSLSFPLTPGNNITIESELPPEFTRLRNTNRYESTN